MSSHTQSCGQDGRPYEGKLFQPFDIGTLRLKNRLVALPVFSGYAHPDGTVSTMLLQHYERLAATGVSMVVVANVAISPDGVTSRHTLRLDQDKFIPGLEKLAQTIHRQKALACIQLNHAGRLAKTDQPLFPAPIDSQNLSFNISALKEFMEFFPLEKRFGLTRHFLRQAKSWRQAMSAGDRHSVLESFGHAAQRAYAAGFDMIELHGGNGYLLCQFLSAFTNPPDLSNSDNFEKRTRFPLAVVKRVKDHLPYGFPLGYRLIVREGVPGGIDVEEAIAFAQLLEKEGIAYLSTTAGSFNSLFLAKEQKVMARPAYLQKEVARLRRYTGVPTIIGGRITTPGLANRLLRLRTADLIGLGRSLRVDKQWVTKAKDAKSKIKTCINCNWCLKRVILEEGFNCQRWSRLQRQKTDLELKLLTFSSNTLIVINDKQDVAIWQTWLARPRLLKLPGNGISKIHLLFLYPPADDTSERARINDLQHAVEDYWTSHGDRKPTVKCIYRPGISSYLSIVQSEIDQGGLGIVLTCRRSDTQRRARLIAQVRNGVVGLIGTDPQPANVLIPVDLSDATLPVLAFVQRFYDDGPSGKLHFIHVRTDTAQTARHRWQYLKKVGDFPARWQLHLLTKREDIANAIAEAADAHRCDTIIMGKRGLSGIKRWLIGSVSAGVLKRLPDRSLLLVD